MIRICFGQEQVGRRTLNEIFTLRPPLKTFLQAVAGSLAFEFEGGCLEGPVNYPAFSLLQDQKDLGTYGAAFVSRRMWRSFSSLGSGRV